MLPLLAIGPSTDGQQDKRKTEAENVKLVERDRKSYRYEIVNAVKISPSNVEGSVRNIRSKTETNGELLPLPFFSAVPYGHPANDTREEGEGQIVARAFERKDVIDVDRGSEGLSNFTTNVENFVYLLKKIYIQQDVAERIDRKCGAYNCFVPEISVKPTRQSHCTPNVCQNFFKQALDAFIVKLLPWKAPETVALRVPRELPSKEETNPSNWKYAMDETWGELKWTIFLASQGVTVPVLLAIPIPIEGTDVTFAYVFESGWTSLENLMVSVARTPASVALLDGKYLADRLAELNTTLAQKGILLFDVKPPNIVVKRLPGDDGKYAIRMIDFDEKFVADANRHVPSGAPTNTYSSLKERASDAGQTIESILPDLAELKTAEACVFLLNSLLLFNTIASHPPFLTDNRAFDHPTLKTFLAETAKTMLDRWNDVKRSADSNPLCAFLNEDVSFAEVYESEGANRGAAHEGFDINLFLLSSGSKEDFYDALRQTFYLLLANYALDKGVRKDLGIGPHAGEWKTLYPEGMDGKGYLEFIVTYLYAKYGN